MNCATMQTISKDLHSKNEHQIIVKKILFDSTLILLELYSFPESIQIITISDHMYLCNNSLVCFLTKSEFLSKYKV